MPGIGPMELIVVLVIALIVLGPKRLPSAGKSLGDGIRQFKGAIAGGEAQPDRADDEEPVERPALREPAAR